MSPSIARHCPSCKNYSELPITTDSDSYLICPHCKAKWGKITNRHNIFDFCPICQCRQFYVTKDFNQLAGCLIMFFGIILVPKTYGLSLPVFALIDWLLYRKVKTITCCYRCGSEFRNFPSSAQFKPFMHHIGLKYDKYR